MNIMDFFTPLLKTGLDIGATYAKIAIQKDMMNDLPSSASSQNQVNYVPALNFTQQPAQNQVLPSTNNSINSSENIALWLIPSAVLAVGLIFALTRK